jgi:DNA-binding MarR family transcriptional regulator
MLKRILSMMATGEVQTQVELATALDVPEPLLSQMVAQLASQGYLTQAAMGADGCEGCSLHMQCNLDRRLRIWTLTEKGQRAAAS